MTYLHDAVSPGIVANDINMYAVLDDSSPVYAEPIWGSMGPNSASPWLA